MVQCAALVQTNHGIVNLIMNEYAFYGRGHSIHSSGQIEWYTNTVDDKSVQVGGQQRIVTIDGYSMPLVCKGGLMYLQLQGIPTDQDLQNYPSVHLTSPHEWDILRAYHISNWHSEPYHQNQNPAECRYRTIKSWTNTVMNRSGALANCWLLCMIYVCYILNHIACGALNGSIPLLVLYGITPDISIMLLYTFYQPVCYASHDQHFRSESEERAAFWVGFGEHCGDAMTHKLLDKFTQKIIYRSAARPLTKSNPNHRLTEDGGEASTSKQPSSKIPTVFIRSRQDDADPSHIKPMPEFDPDDLIGRTFLLPPQENGERLRAKVTKKVVEEIEAADGNRIPNINFILDIGEGKVEELITYTQLLDHLEQAEEQDNFMD